MAKKQLRRVSDVLVGPEGADAAVPFDSVLGNEYVIEGFAVVEGKYGPLAYITCLDGDVRLVVRTGSAVVLDQLERIAEHLPLLAEFEQIERYYVLR